MTARGAGEAAESIALEVLHGAMQAEDLQQQPWPGLGTLHGAQLQGQGICPQRQATVKAGNVCLALQTGVILGNQTSGCGTMLCCCHACQEDLSAPGQGLQCASSCSSHESVSNCRTPPGHGSLSRQQFARKHGDQQA